MQEYIDFGKQKGRGLQVVNMGGRIGWLTRRLFPLASTQIYLTYLRWSKTAATRRRFAQFREREELAWFTHMEIETINRCNGVCSFCPVNVKSDPRPLAKMTDQLFTSLLEQLSEVEYCGYLGLFSNNEPLLDPRLADFAAMARQRLSKAFLNLMTNGTLLDVDLFRKLMRSFDRIVIDNYNDKPVMKKNIQEIHAFCRTPEGESLLRGKTLEISLRNGQDVLSTRAGQSPNKKAPRKALGIPCLLPYIQFVARPDGKVSLCCNDALGLNTLGDITQSSIADIWRGRAFQDIRDRMARLGREGIASCKGCDFTKIDVV